jgi:drug/metabolite transporter (DMT)-like permease
LHTSAKQNFKLLATVALILNALVWGLSWWPFRELQAAGLHPLWATLLVYVLSMACLLTVYPRAWQSWVSHPELWWLVLAAGLTNVGFNWAVAIGDVVRVVLLFYLMPAWTMLFAWWLLREQPHQSTWLRLGVALVGVLIVLKTPDSAWPVPSGLADWLGLMGGAAFALTNVMLRRLAHTPRESRMLAMFGGGALLAAAIAVPMSLQAALPMPSHIHYWWLLAALLAFLLLLGNVALQYGAARLQANTAALVMLTEIVFASVSSVMLGVSQLNWRIGLGGGLIILVALWAALED